jgi:uncharacterized protein YndB with AHSA1/START domain
MRTNDEIDPIEDRQIVTVRLIDAPRHLVFQAWSEPRHLARWFGPHGFTTTTHAFEFRTGGVWSFDMHGQDGTRYPNWIQWRQIVPPRLITFRQGTSADDPQAFDSSVAFEDRDGATELTLRAVLASKAQRDLLAERFRAVEGARETLERLASYAHELLAGRRADR